MKPPRRTFRLLLAALGFAVIACGDEQSGEKKAKIERTHATRERTLEEVYAFDYFWHVDLLQKEGEKLVEKRTWTPYMHYDATAMVPIPDDIYVSFDYWQHPVDASPDDTTVNYIHLSVQLLSSLRQDCLDPVNAKTSKEYFLTKEAIKITAQDLWQERNSGPDSGRSNFVNYTLKFALIKAMRENGLITVCEETVEGKEQRFLSQILVNVYAGKSPKLKKHILKSQYVNPICVGFDPNKQYRGSGV